jgi:hypothetical protein
VVIAPGTRKRSNEVTMQDPSGEITPNEIHIALRNYWHETISRDEAFRRLEGRDLPPERRSAVENTIPDGETRHFLTFYGGAFREYVAFPDEPAKLLLILPIRQKEENKFEVPVPVTSERTSDGRIRNIVGIDFEEYQFTDGTLVENGTPRETFEFVEGPTELVVDVSFVSPAGPELEREKHPGGGGCCGACEWVHSALDIHCADWLCCLGTCAQ